jgi:ubiquinone biosynthesis protein
MEFVRGVKIIDVAALDAAGVDRVALAERFVRAMIKQLLIDGFFHGDPHPGNVLVDPKTSTIIFLDCGMVGDLSAEQRMQLMDLIFSLMQADTRELAGIFLGLSVRFKDVDELAFTRDLDRLLGRYLLYSDAQPDLSLVIGGTLSLMYRHGLRLNNTLTLALKTLIQAEEITTTLAPTTSLVAVAYAQVKELLAEQVTVDNAVDLLKREGLRSVKQVIRRIPSLSEATLSWLDQYQSGRFTVHLDAGDLSNQMRYFGHSVKRLTVGLVLVGMLVSSAIAILIPFSPEYALLPLIAMVLLIGSMALSVVLVLRMINDIWRPD